MQGSERKIDLQIHVPRQGPTLPKPRPEQVLFVCHYEPTGVSTLTETAAFLQTFSAFPITVLNMYEHRYAVGPIMFPPGIDLDCYAAIIFHSTITYNSENIYAIDRHTRRKLKDFAGVKILMKQDDNHKFRHLRPYIGEAGIDLVLTCLPPEAVPIVYPPADVGHARFERMLTGYVTPTLRAIADPGLPRPIDIGYRGSIMPLWFGRLCYDKHRIGTAVAERLAGRGVTLDVSNRTEDRLGNEAWFDFLLSCKATLGTESGASIFDLDGDLHARVSAIEGRIGPYREDEAYAEAYLSRLADLENVIAYGQVSPRHFEAAACRTLQILFPGQYSGIFTANDHYFPLAYDFSNLDEAVDLTRDDLRRSAITGRAYEEVINNSRYWIESFIQRLDELVLDLAEAKGVLRKVRTSGGGAGRNVLALAVADSPGDTRWTWLRADAPEELCLHKIAVRDSDTTGPEDRDVDLTPLDWRLDAPTWIAGEAFGWPCRLGGGQGVADAVRDLCFIEGLLELDDASLCRALRAPPHSPRLPIWRAHLASFLAVTKRLVDVGQDLRGLHAIVASDLRCLPAAVILSHALGVPLVYDSARCESEADPEAQEFERQFLSDLEARLLRHVAYRIAASPELANWLQMRHGLPFESIRNAPPRRPPEARSDRDTRRTVLLITSRAADGLSRAVLEAWSDVRPGARMRVYSEGRGHVLDCESGPMPERAGAVGDPPEATLTALITNADAVVVAVDPAYTNDRVTVPAAIPLCLAGSVPIIAHPAPALGSALAGAGGAVLTNLRNRRNLAHQLDMLVAASPRPDELETDASQRNCRDYHDRLLDLVTHAEPSMLRVFEVSEDAGLAGDSVDAVQTPDLAKVPYHHGSAAAPTPALYQAVTRAPTLRLPWASFGILRRLVTRVRRRAPP